MSEMIERVAEALAWDGDGYAWGRMVEEERQSYRRRAIIAIKAMREPPTLKDPYEIGYHPNSDTAAIWRAYIDVALK